MKCRRMLLGLGAAAAVALGAAGAALAHGPGGYGGYGGGPYGWHMGPHMGPGMMGYGMGPGMMGYGMGPGMMGRYGYGMGPGMMQPLRRDLSVDDVKHIMEHRLAWQGERDLKLGKVEEKDDDTIVAEIVTDDGEAVETVEVNRHTGWMRRVR